MDIEKLIHCLQCCARVDAHNGGCDDCGLDYCGPECQQLCGTAATALSTLQAENEKLRVEAEGMRSNWYKSVGKNKQLQAELEQVKEEKAKAIENLSDNLRIAYQSRDAAVEDMTEMIGDIEEIRRGCGVDNADADSAFANLCGNYCANNGHCCYEESENYRCKHFEWRGMAKEN